MATRDGLVLVLWAPRFDELAATVFVTALREAGLKVKLVSLSRRFAGGSHGLGLVPDLSLEEVLPLAGAVTCIVLPCGAGDVRSLAADPRVRDLLWLARSQHAQVVVSAGSDAILTELDLVAPSNGSLVTYLLDKDLPLFATALAGTLSFAL